MHHPAFDRVLGEYAPSANFLSADEIAGAWRELYPDLAEHLPRPYPIYTPDESGIIDWGYPIRDGGGWKELEDGLAEHLDCEASLALGCSGGGGIEGCRAKSLHLISWQLENALLNDYGRQLPEVFLLLLSATVSKAIAKVVVRLRASGLEEDVISRWRFAAAAGIIDSLALAGRQISDRLRLLAAAPVLEEVRPLAEILSAEALPFAVDELDADLSCLVGWLDARDKISGGLMRQLAEIRVRLKGCLADDPELENLIELVAGRRIDLHRSAAILEPDLMLSLEKLGRLDELGLQVGEARILSGLGRQAKRFELIRGLQTGLRRVAEVGEGLALIKGAERIAIAASARPLDFGLPGVVDTAVRRFGLIYDLTSFTAQLETVRSGGRSSEERALRFMYIFQQRVEALHRRHRLTFEKFLGDGAFFSARRAVPVLRAALEIQALFVELCQIGFPFDRGLRIAMNFSTFHLMPMASVDSRSSRFEFFGHGIVELSRLVTGKSGGEIERIETFLLNSGYSREKVESFLSPLLGAAESQPARRLAAWIDEHGELVNEGIVMTPAFLECFVSELDSPTVRRVARQGRHWLALELPEMEGCEPFSLGLREIGVARLKGLEPLELIEVVSFEQPPESGEPLARLDANALRELRLESEQAPQVLDKDLVLVCWTDAAGDRRWALGRQSVRGDVIDAREVEPPHPEPYTKVALGQWIEAERFELASSYESQGASGKFLDLDELRRSGTFVGVFLCAPQGPFL